MGDRCFICSGGKWENVFTSPKSPQFIYRRCGDCKFIQLAPVPTDEQLKAFYERTWGDEVSGSYKDRYLGVKVSQDKKKYLQWYQEDFTSIRAMLRSKMEVHFFEVGVGAGYMMAAASELGWDCTGIDISEAGVGNLAEQGYKVIHGDFLAGNDRIEPHSFDVIHMNHVLEHFRNPNMALNRVKSLLRPGGIFWVAVPTIDERLFQFMYKPWRTLYSLSGACRGLHPFFWSFNSPAHISCYSAESLKRQLEGHGFIIRHEENHLPRLARTQSWLRHMRSLSIIPFYLLSKSGWEVKVIAQWPEA